MKQRWFTFRRFVKMFGILLFAIPAVVIAAIVVLLGQLLGSWLSR